MPMEKRRAVVTTLLAILGVIIEWYYLSYMLDRGLGDKTIDFTVLRGSLPIAVLPAVGALLVFLASWNYVSQKMLPTRVRLEPRGRGLPAWLAATKAAALITATFISTLFLPYAFWSDWFLGIIGKVVGLIPQAREVFLGLYNGTAGIWQLEALWKYVTSLNLSALITAFIAVAYTRRATRVRKAK